jgi:hypothetical protein
MNKLSNQQIKLDERNHVEAPLLDQLKGLGWEVALSGLPGPHRFSSAGCMELLLAAYEPNLGLLPHADDKGIVTFHALGPVCRRVQRGVDLAAQ